MGDNDFKIFDLAGNLIRHHQFIDTKVYDVQWRPGHFTKLPLMPTPGGGLKARKGNPKEEEKEQKPRRIMRREGRDNFVTKMLEKERNVDNRSRRVDGNTNIFGKNSNF